MTEATSYDPYAWLIRLRDTAQGPAAAGRRAQREFEEIIPLSANPDFNRAFVDHYLGFVGSYFTEDTAVSALGGIDGLNEMEAWLSRWSADLQLEGLRHFDPERRAALMYIGRNVLQQRAADEAAMSRAQIGSE